MSGMMASSSLVQAIEQSGGYLPRIVRQEFEDYLKCGLLEHGFLRVKCFGPPSTAPAGPTTTS
jgi:hypothetical protein